MKIIEKQHLGYYEARNLAIRENWFTKATNEDYEHWLKECDSKDHFDLLTLFDLAKYAAWYSDISNYTDRAEAIESFMFAMKRAMVSVFTIEDYNSADLTKRGF